MNSSTTSNQGPPLPQGSSGLKDLAAASSTAPCSTTDSSQKEPSSDPSATGDTSSTYWKNRYLALNKAVQNLVLTAGQPVITEPKRASEAPDRPQTAPEYRDGLTGEGEGFISMDGALLALVGEMTNRSIPSSHQAVAALLEVREKVSESFQDGLRLQVAFKSSTVKDTLTLDLDNPHARNALRYYVQLIYGDMPQYAASIEERYRL